MSATRVVGTVAMALAVAGFATLGTWQLQRAGWKERLLAAHAQAATAPPRELAPLLAVHDALPARADLAQDETADAALPLRVVARGRYDAGRTVLLDNQLRDGHAGVMVLTAFLPDDARGRAVLVNRGWLALGDERQVPALPLPPDGETTIAGMLVSPPSVGVRLGNARYERTAPPPLLAYVDTEELAVQMDMPLFAGTVQLDAAAAGGFAREWPVLPNTLPPERHRGYAVQWYALALAVLVTWIVLMRRRAR